MMKMSICVIGIIENLKKRRQNEDKHLNFHLHNTPCLPKGVQNIS